MTRRYFFLPLFALSALTAQSTQAEVFHFGSVDWPPYTDSTLPDGGVFTAIVRAALAAEGHGMEVSYQPWLRTVRDVSNNPDAAGAFPIYSEDLGLEDGFSPSPPLMHSPLGLAERTAYPLRDWQTVEGLNPYRIGVVLGYSNGVAFDAAMESRKLWTEVAPNDLANLRKLASGRLDAAVVDQIVLAHFQRQHAKELNGIRFHRRLLEMKDLHVAFKITTTGQRAQESLLRGLAKIDPDLIAREWFCQQ
ncbi:substrate-binding periplasmic protein [Lacibacterium aquatile]|uniref:Substrate-binding periplasmic protein n=1 Tax=Lacibacterium aquatile TaxID=1168082 RepID=A0ABW5DYD6_9PROT